MTRTEIRFECLKLSVPYHREPAQVMAVAKAYEDFLLGAESEAAIEERAEDLKGKKPESKKLASK